MACKSLQPVSFQKPSADFWGVWRAFTPLNTFVSTQRTMTGLKWILQRAAFHWTTTTTPTNWLMKLGLCAAPIQWRKKTKLRRNQVDLSSVKFHSRSEETRKAKKVLVENNLSTASFPLRFFIQLSSQTVHMSCDFPLVCRKLLWHPVVL